MMNWQRLLARERLRRPDASVGEGRSPFQQDLDRIVFSAAFRRLAHKTQVHPLSPNDHVHTRLTHSIEVASVGRSLGTIVGAKIAADLRDPEITGDAFGYVVQAACLAHDIGNPPFGHSGEEAISNWFRRCEVDGANFGLSDAQCEDFRSFEGNSQGFRILTQLENYKWDGGLQLTYAVLGTFSKYPRSSVVKLKPGENYVGGKKIGFFQAECANFREVADRLGLRRKRGNDEDYWCRHPLAFLVEAADDICYAIIDIEDGYELKYLDFADAAKILHAIAGDKANLSSSMEPKDQIGKLRAVAIGELVSETSRVFLENERAIIDGDFGEELIARTKFKSEIAAAKELAKHKLYWSERKTKLEIAGSEVISGLLGIFSELVIALGKVDYDRSKLRGTAQRLARLMGPSLGPVADPYSVMLCVTDFISGMTDRYAVDLYRALTGISTDP